MKIVKKTQEDKKDQNMLVLACPGSGKTHLSKILEKNGFYIAKTIFDYQKIKRCLIARKIK